MKKQWTVILVILAVLFLALAIYYWVTPAGSLPHFFPGYERLVHRAHFKHGLAALILAVLFGIGAWFESGKKSTSVQSKSKE